MISSYRLHKLSGIIGILVLLFSPCLASAQEEEYAEYEKQPSVYWHVDINAQGKALTNLTFMARKDGPDATGAREELTAALQEALQCRLENVNFHANKFNFQINAECQVPVQKNDLVLQVLLKPSALRSHLERRGQFRITLSLTVPKLGFGRAPREAKEFSYGARTTYSLSIQPEEQTIKDLSLEFGYRTGYVIALSATIAIVLFGPILLILVVRKRSLALAGRDATAAWFGYWRVHRWIVEGIWLVWLIALSTFNVETFIGFLSGSNQPVLNALLLFGPPVIVSFTCQYLSRPVWFRVRGIAWNRREMLLKGFWEQAAAILPLAFIIIGIGSVVQHDGKAMLWFAAALVAQLFGAWMHGKISKTMPCALHGGELKEKILEMAQRAGVKIQQVFLMPSQQLRMGNAFAMQGQRVMITDYLLERLTKQETDCVMAHEIGHVKKRHTLLLSWAGFLVIFLAINAALWIAFTIVPAFIPFLMSANPERILAVQGWISEYLFYPVTLLSAVLVRYFLSRRFERSADEFAALLTNDPESMITSLVKLSKMNLMPIGWGRWDEGLSTHPSTLRRVEAIAKNHGIPKDRLQALLDTQPRRNEGTGYTAPDEAINPRLVFSTERKTRHSLMNIFSLFFVVALLPLLLGRSISLAGLSASAYAIGILVVPFFYIVVAAFVSLRGYRGIKRDLAAKLQRSGIRQDLSQAHFVGIVPEEHPRNYDSHMVWDVGFLTMEEGALVYLGDKSSFRIPRETITSISQGPSYPGWISLPETYIRWSDEEKKRVFHLHSLEGSSTFGSAGRSKALLLSLMDWHQGRIAGSLSSTRDTDLPLPAFPDVKGLHPRAVVALKGVLTAWMLLLFLVFGFSALLKLDSALSWYGFGMATWCLIVGNIPSWRYTDGGQKIKPLSRPEAGHLPQQELRTEGPALSDGEMARRTNKRLAIGIAVLGLSALGAFYALFFSLAMFKPGLLFSFMPSPPTMTIAQSDGSRIYLLYSRPDMSTLSLQEKRRPQEKYFYSLLDGAALSEPRETPEFVTASGSDERLVLFGNGGYWSFDGSTWTEARTEGIGQYPKGITTPQGLYVMSTVNDTLQLNHIVAGSVTRIPFPDEFLKSGSDHAFQFTELAGCQGQLCLFWSTDKTIHWTFWNGAAWAPAATSPFSGAFQVAADEKRLYFFHQDGRGLERTLNYYVMENNEWTGPSRLPVQEHFKDWGVFMHKGKPMFLAHRPFAQTLYTVEGGTLTNPVSIKGSFSPHRVAGSMALIAVCANLGLFLFIYGVSVMIGRYKKGSLTQDETHYEYASLFRRFLANFIDTMVILLPPALYLTLFVITNDLSQNPFRIVFMVLLTIVFYLLGGFLYHSVLEGLLGATLGKKVCGIKVLKSDFTPCGISAGLLRNVLRVIDSFFYYLVGVVAMAGTLKWQRLGDMIADTIVVRWK